MASNNLPEPESNQAYVEASCVFAGRLTPSENMFIQGAPHKKFEIPTMSFLIQHPSGKKLVFDLGLRQDPENYPPLVCERIKENFEPMITVPDVAASLERGGLSTDDIDLVIVSHVHWDHVGDPWRFPKSKFIVGPKTYDVLENGAPPHFNKGLFSPTYFPRDRTTELPEVGSDNKTWSPVGPFPHAHDLYGDGSVYVINAPGHVPGHANLLARLGPKRWVYLAGDACHHPTLLWGQNEIAVHVDSCGLQICAHSDLQAAKETLGRIREVKAISERQGHDLQVILAHDEEWYQNNTPKAFYPGKI